jgi:hypothetical protein
MLCYPSRVFKSFNCSSVWSQNKWISANTRRKIRGQPNFSPPLRHEDTKSENGARQESLPLSCLAPYPGIWENVKTYDAPPGRAKRGRQHAG